MTEKYGQIEGKCCLVRVRAIEALHPEKQEVTRELRAKGNEGARRVEKISPLRAALVFFPRSFRSLLEMRSLLAG